MIFSIIHYLLKSEYLLFIIFFLLFIKNIGLFILFKPSLFTIFWLIIHYSLYKKVIIRLSLYLIQNLSM